MCRRLGKKHFQYIDVAAELAAKHHEKAYYSGHPIASTYRFKLLNDVCFIRDVFWNPQHRSHVGIEKRLTKAKQQRYKKLDRYFDRVCTGR